jgi:Cys-tRNA(Pro) deacylase
MNLRQQLEKAGVDFELISKPETVHTADASAVSGIRLEQITKSLVCLDPEGRAWVAVIAGDRKLDLKALAQELGVKKMKMCPFDEAHKYSGYPPGATPPVLHRKIAGVVFDEPLTALEMIYGGGGDNRTLLKINTRQAIALVKARIAAVSV